MSSFPSLFSAPPPDKPLKFEDIQRFLAYAKIVIVELASILGLLAILYEGLKHEMKW